MSAKFWLEPVTLAKNLGFATLELRRLQWIVIENRNLTLAPSADERAKNVTFTDDTFSVELMNGRTIVVPIAWYPKLLNASTTQRTN